MLPELAQPRDINSVISVLSAMVTPAVLILASALTEMSYLNRFCVPEKRD